MTQNAQLSGVTWARRALHLIALLAVVFFGALPMFAQFDTGTITGPEGLRIVVDEAVADIDASDVAVTPATDAKVETDGDVVMVKGSLGSRMGPIVKALQRLDCKVAELLPYRFTGGFVTIWEKA